MQKQIPQKQPNCAALVRQEGCWES